MSDPSHASFLQAINHSLSEYIQTALGGTQARSDVASELKSCTQCDVDRQMFATPERALIENLHTLIFHLNARAIRLTEQALHDPLTGLGNRRKYEQVIERELAVTQRNRQRLGFVAADIDGLKTINGHDAGDVAIQSCAHVLRTVVRRSDLVFRMGGDEFLIVLAANDEDTFRGVIRRIRGGLAEWNRAHADEHGFSLAVSLGWTSCADSGDLAEVVRRADNRMYGDKRARRSTTGGPEGGAHGPSEHARGA